MDKLKLIKKIKKLALRFALSGPPVNAKQARKLALQLAQYGRPENDRQNHDCPLCGYHGPFKPRFSSQDIRLDGYCPQCGSLERHRHLILWLNEGGPKQFGRTLHFAPEACIKDLISSKASDYLTADFAEGRADLKLNIEAIDMDDASVDTVIANHVLEHVDDKKALAELYRILRPGGRAILTFPVISSWPTSYEDPAFVTEAERHRHFGQRDHVRYFGWDCTTRIGDAGFELDIVLANGADSAKYALARGGSIFHAVKPV